MTHPRHDVMAEVAPGLWDIARPIHPTGLTGWRTRRACRKAGGHWWHADRHDITGWWCCACGAPCEGMPEDGNSTWRLYWARGRKQIRLGIWRHRPDRVSPEYRWVGLTWQL
jgi:hypothetical protein